MLHVEKLNLEQIKTIYYSHMQEAFPQSELRPYRNIEMLTQNGYYVCYGLYDEGNLLAYAYFARPASGQYVLLDYYAVLKELRGTGIGSSFFPLLKEKMQETNGILIEVESVESTEDPEEIKLRRRRISFYERNGCVMTRAKCLLYGVDFSIMTLPVSTPVPNDETILSELEKIYHTMFDDELYSRVCFPSIKA